MSQAIFLSKDFFGRFSQETEEKVFVFLVSFISGFLKLLFLLSSSGGSLNHVHNFGQDCFTCSSLLPASMFEVFDEKSSVVREKSRSIVFCEFLGLTLSIDVISPGLDELRSLKCNFAFLDCVSLITEISKIDIWDKKMHIGQSPKTSSYPPAYFC